MFSLVTRYILRRYSREVRVRFAPSPTGDLHLGGLRTAFYNYLFAKKYNGSFVLRLEDTDRERYNSSSAENIEKMLRWVGIPPDESPSVGGSYGPYIQSERLELYDEAIKTLINNGSAYRCFCSEKKLELLKKESARARRVNKYDGRCFQLSQSEINEKLNSGLKYTVRFRLKPFKKGFEDIVFGHTHHDIFEHEGDPIIYKSDGYPTYHLANVVDDHHMKISHVFRGVEWQVSTPKHILLYEAFGWEPPVFGHLPLITNQDGTKLSKRQRDISIQYYKENGYYPETLQNFLATVGGGFNNRDQSCENIYNTFELIDMFDPSRISTVSSKVEKEKLSTLSRFTIKMYLSNENSRVSLLNDVRRQYPEILMNDDVLLAKLEWAWNRIHKLSDLQDNTSVSFIWFPPSEYRFKDIISAPEILARIKTSLSEPGDPFKNLKSLAKSFNVKPSQLSQDIRLALCGAKQGPPLKEMIEALGLQEVQKRLDKTIEYMKK